MSAFINGLQKVMAVGLLGISPELALENTNILGYDQAQYTTDFNRLRADLSLSHEKYQDVVGKVIVDNKKPRH
ncbi:MAG: hypothetical protein D3909_15800, partial [Candidatus Electrothrix sp. ATG1]|nr:hypothetical protein [Candidatus Electrothrix sp. ATG1]